MNSESNTHQALDDLPPSQLISVIKLALATDTSRSFWDMRRHRGQKPAFVRIGRSVRYKVSDIRDFISRGDAS